eukprot:scaffold3820_cov90-Cylindrotheca_fusiformis.AAC.2
MLATNVIEAERAVENLFYSGERQPHMWWDRFERELREAYATLDMNAGRPVTRPSCESWSTTASMPTSSREQKTSY